MAVYHCLKLVPPSLVALQRESCRHNKLVCYSAESAYNYYHRLAFGFFLYNAFKAQNAFTEPTDVPPNFNTFIFL